MNSLAVQGPFEQIDGEHTSALETQEKAPGWILQELTPKHMEALAYIAQGMKKKQAAAIVGFTPEYITMLLRQPLCREYIAKLNETVGAQLEALFGQTVEVIRETMEVGSPKEKLAAARLQLEATKRIGRSDNSTPSPVNADERLIALSDRLVGLLDRQREASTQRMEFIDVTPLPAPE